MPKIFVVRVLTQWYNLGTGVDCMDFKDVEKRMYRDEEFLKYLPLLKEEYWKKASPNKRVKIFNELQRIIHDVEPLFPLKIEVCEFDSREHQNVIVTEDSILINEELFKKTYNPYNIITNYLFELSIVNNLAMIGDADFLKTELGRRMEINSQESITGQEENFLPRTSEEFYLQPITIEAEKVANNMIFKLLQYMHRTHGMDKYIGEKVTGLMLNSFETEKRKGKAEDTFKKMEENAARFKEEETRMDQFFDYLENVNFNKISDEEFFSYFNTKIMPVCNTETICYLFGKMLERELKGCKHLDEILNEFTVGEHEEHGKFIYMGGALVLVNSYAEAFLNLITYISNVKLRENLCTEIQDKKFLDDAKLCYEYIIELQDEECCIAVPYLENALSYYEYKNIMIENYYKKIYSAIKNGEYFKDALPYLPRGDFSKYEAFLAFTFNKTFEEVKKEQFDYLEAQVSKKFGGGK